MRALQRLATALTLSLTASDTGNRTPAPLLYPGRAPLTQEPICRKRGR
jgi:hypothetical protein